MTRRTARAARTFRTHAVRDDSTTIGDLEVLT